MTGTPPGQPPSDLTARLFRALYPAFELRTISGTRIVTPRGTSVLIGGSLGQIARQLSTRRPQHPGYDQPPVDSPATPDQSI